MEIREKIVRETYDMMMKYGIKSVSMDDISRGLGISKKTIYQHFENKKDLVTNVVGSFLEKDVADINKIINSSTDALDEIITIAKHIIKALRTISPSAMYDMKKYYAQQWQVVEEHHSAYVYSVIRNNIERGKKEGLYLKGINANIVAKLYVLKNMVVVDEDTFPLEEFSRDELFKTMISYHIRGIVSEEGAARIKDINLD